MKPLSKPFEIRESEDFRIVKNDSKLNPTFIDKDYLNA